MVNIKELTADDIGKWVKYSDGTGRYEIGRIKSWNEYFIFVVYKCNDEWDRYQDFTGQATSQQDLEFVFEYCLGEGVVSCDESDGEGHIMKGVGTQKCVCQIKDEDESVDN